MQSYVIDQDRQYSWFEIIVTNCHWDRATVLPGVSTRSDKSIFYTHVDVQILEKALC